MPMSSAEIAQMNGAFAQASMQRMSYASSISQGAIYGGQSGQGADALMGGAMNRGAAIGGPLMGGAMGMLGLDPMSMGLKAGMGAFGAGAGLGGAALAGAGVALPMMAAGAAINYGAQQMYTGAHQQGQLNETLRGSYNFRNQQGGSGFSRGDMTSIGGMMRNMSEQFGPGGEIAGFGELTQLAGKMSTMGLAQGVRDVQEFGKRFKDMVGTLKTMAKDLGTTLEGAMEFAASAKQSGVFGMSSIGRFTSAVRGASVAGGLATSEVTSAASIGSQISRSVGGLGSQGAMAGIRTIGQIGTAQQMGVLSEENIYNATGLTGAEGRQAFAASQLQRAGSWLQSGRGRRMLASVAGKNGTLDETAVEQIMGGGMGIAETMQQDRSHTTGPGGIGRANFIRNEGRLRGAALARFGAFLPAMQLQQWAGSKGIDINEMDDRSMLFAQRQLGMGRDELDAAVKMATNMPQIMRTMQGSERQDQYFQQLSQQRKGQGLSGVKQRYEQARELVNNKLQKVGQDIFNSGSDLIDNFFNGLMGNYVETYSKDIDEAYRAMSTGTSSGRARGERAFGGGGRAKFAPPASFTLGGAGGADLATEMNRGVTGGFFENVKGGAGSGASALSGYLGVTGAELGGLYGGALGAAKWIAQGESGVSKMKGAGFDLTGMSSKAMESKLRDIEMSRLAYTTGGVQEMTADTRDKIRQAYVFGVGGAGDDRITSIQAALETTDPVMAARLRNAKGAQKAALIGEIERGAGVGAGSGLMANYNTPGGIPGVGGTKGFTSEAAENRAWAQAMGTGTGYGMKEKLGGAALGGLASGLVGALTLGVGSLVMNATGATDSISDAATDLVGRQTGNFQKQQAAGKFYKGKAFRDAAIGLLSSDANVRAAARDKIQQDFLDAGEGGELAGEYQKMLRASDAMEALARVGGDKSKLSSDERSMVEANEGMLGKMGGAVMAQQQRDRREMQRRVQSMGKDDLAKLAAAGVYDAGKGVLTVDDSKLSLSARAYLQAAVDITKGEAGGELGSASQFEHQADRRARMSDKELLSVSGSLAGTRQGEEGMYELGMRKRVAASMRGGGKNMLNQMLGLGLGKDQLGAMSIESVIASAGVTDKESIARMRMVLGDKASTVGQKTAALRGLQEDEGYQKHQKEMSEKEAEAKDPLGAKQVEQQKEMLKHLEMIAKNTASTSENTAKKDDNPENKDAKTPS